MTGARRVGAPNAAGPLEASRGRPTPPYATCRGQGSRVSPPPLPGVRARSGGRAPFAGPGLPVGGAARSASGARGAPSRKRGKPPERPRAGRAHRGPLLTLVEVFVRLVLLVLLAHVRPGPGARPPRQAQAVRRRFRSGPGERRAGAGPARPRAARQGGGVRRAARGPSREDGERDAAGARERRRVSDRPAPRRERGLGGHAGCGQLRVAAPGGWRWHCRLWVGGGARAGGVAGAWPTL